MDLKRIAYYRKEIMGLAAFWIFYLHFGPCLLENSHFSVIKEIEWYINHVGYCGVEIFLFLSGMGLVYSVRKRSIKEFYVRRFMRVYTSFFIWFTLSTVVRDDAMSLFDYVKRITFYTNWTHDMLDYKWFVAAIMMFYLWFPLYYNILKKVKRPVAFTVILTVVEFYCTSIWYFQIRDDLFLVLDRIPIFLLGILLGHLMAEMPDTRSWNIRWGKQQWMIVCIITCILSVFKYHLMLTQTSGWLHNVENILTSVLSILYCMIVSKCFSLSEKSAVIGVFRKGLRFLGALSLEFYLTHELVSFKVESYALKLVPFDPINQILIFLLEFVLSLIAAWMVLKISDIIFKGKWKRIKTTIGNFLSHA